MGCNTNCYNKIRGDKKRRTFVLKALLLSRGDRTRTCDSLVPNQERYQLRYTSVAQLKCYPFCFAVAKVQTFFELCKFFGNYFIIFCSLNIFASI